MTLTTKEIEAVENCEHCGQAFDVSLPDYDEHRYVCEEKECQQVVCWDCKEMDKYGSDRCPDHHHLNEH